MSLIDVRWFLLFVFLFFFIFCCCAVLVLFSGFAFLFLCCLCFLFFCFLLWVWLVVWGRERDWKDYTFIFPVVTRRSLMSALPEYYNYDVIYLPFFPGG